MLLRFVKHVIWHALNNQQHPPPTPRINTLVDWEYLGLLSGVGPGLGSGVCLEAPVLPHVFPVSAQAAPGVC